jgi:hypothetical protein
MVDPCPPYSLPYFAGPEAKMEFLNSQDEIVVDLETCYS